MDHQEWGAVKEEDRRELKKKSTELRRGVGMAGGGGALMEGTGHLMK